MSRAKKLSRVVGLAALAATVVGLAAPALASPVPPQPSSALSGTWVNVVPSTRSVKQVVIAPSDRGVMVDAFGACTPSLCEWGRVPAIVYGVNVSAKSGATFQTNQRFLAGGKEWSRTALQGTVTQTRSGLRLTLRELTVFEDGSGRKNYTVTETFARGRAAKTSLNGNPVPTYPLGNPPALVTGAFGTWKNVSAGGALAGVRIAGSPAHPVVQAFGRCTPTACSWGRALGITYGPSIGSATGSTVLAPYTFSFKRAQLVISYSHPRGQRERLTIAEYNEFTDHSGRSNYAMTETFVRV